jgi:hypothetical protein
MVDLDETETTDVSEGAISLFKSTTGTANALTVSLDREAYEDRLLSFKATTFYAKPASLSPLVCARFG